MYYVYRGGHRKGMQSWKNLKISNKHGGWGSKINNFEQKNFLNGPEQSLLVSNV